MTASITVQSKKHTAKKILFFLFALVFWISVWWGASHLIGEDLKIFLPSPFKVAKTFCELLFKKDFYLATALTILRILSGFILGAAAGIISGILTSSFKLADIIISPALRVIRAVPVVSFIILAFLFMSIDALPVFISFLMVLPIIHGNVCEGLKNTPTDLIEMSRIYNLSFKQKLTKLYLPSILPYFSAGFKTSLGLAWKAGVAAEVLSFPKNSIGKQLYEGKTYLETVDVFAWTLTVIVISVILEFLLMEAFKKLTARKRGANNI